MKKLSKKTKKVAMEAGAGVLTAVALAAAGAYLLSDKKTRAKAKVWTVKARREIGRNVKIARKMGEKEYKYLVDHAVKRYGSLQNASAAEIMQAAMELKSEWKRMQAEAKKMARKPRRRKARRAAPKKKARRGRA
jgi:hypothetical protein